MRSTVAAAAIFLLVVPSVVNRFRVWHQRLNVSPDLYQQRDGERFFDRYVKRQWNPKRLCEEWMPLFQHDAKKILGIGTGGLTFPAYFWYFVVVGRQYFGNMVKKRVTRYMIRETKPQDAKDVYRFAVNTAVACFMNNEGHVVMHDMFLPRCTRFGPLGKRGHDETSLYQFEKVTLFLDHEHEVATGLEN